MNRRGVHRKQTATPGTHTHDTRDARHRASSSQGSHSATEERTCDRAAVARRRRPPGGRGRGARRGGAQAAAASGGRARPLLRGVRSACGCGAAQDSTRPGPRAAAPLQRPRGVSGRGAPRPLEDLLVPSAREAARRTAEEQTGRRGAEARGPERPRHRGAQAPPAPARGRGAWRTPDGPRGPRGQSRLPALRPGPRLGTRGAGAAFFRRPPRGRAAARHAQVPSRQRGGFGVRVHPRRPAPQRREPPFPPQGERGTPRGGVTVRGGLRGRGREGRGPGAQEGPAPRPRPPYLVHRAAREVQRPEQQLELHGRREAVEAEADVVDDRGRQQRRDAGRRP